jgi:RHS repeat-associated protein
VEGSYISLPFGDGQVTSGSDTDANHYAQLDHDTESDTDHAQFRQYSNAHGRWLAPDPYSGSYDASNPQSMNRYVYALNSPLAAVDPSGLICYGDARDLLPFSGCAVQKTNTGAGGGSYSPSGYVAVSGGNGTTIFTASDWQFIKDSPGNNGITVNPDGTISAAGNNNAGWWVQFTTFGLVIGQSNNVGKGGSTGGGDGGGGGGSPYNGPNYTLHDVCVASAVLHTGLGTALDVIGIIPGLNDVVALTTGLGSASMAVFGNGFGDESTFADFALSGAGLGLTWVNTLKTIGGTAGKAVPVAGNILSGYSTYRDIKGMNAYYNDCMAGKN